MSNEMPYAGFDLSGVWEPEDEYTSPGEATDERIAEVEALLGYKLPASYVALLRVQNGGSLVNACYPMDVPTIWAQDHIAIDGISGIGGTWGLDSPDFGSRFMIEEWRYPDIGIVFGQCPSGGHDAIMLDYRECGPQGEPKVIHVDVETVGDPEITPVADNFEQFIRGLVNRDVYDTSAEDKLADLETARRAPFTPLLLRLCDRAGAVLPNAETVIRRLAEEIVETKGFFSLHADPLSHLMYDLEFLLYVHAEGPAFREAYLEAYPGILVFGQGDVFKTGGYAPGFVADWLDARIESGAIAPAGAADAGLAFIDAYRRELAGQAAPYRGK